MIGHLIEPVKELVRQEREHAIETHAPYFHSGCESVGKQEEELIECEREFREMQNGWSMFKYQVYAHNGINIKEVERLKKHAIFLACEAIQVAAVASKTIASTELWNEYGELPLAEESWLKELEAEND